ncbi:hypothetical protein [Streptomyces filamentosus]
MTIVSDGRGRRYASGWEGDVPDQLGEAWVAAGLAEATDGPTAPDAPEGKRTRKRTTARRAPRTATPPTE